MEMIKKLVPHICIVLAGMFITFVIVDRLNSFMAVLDNGTAKTLLLLFSVIAVIVSVMLVKKQRKEE